MLSGAWSAKSAYSTTDWRRGRPSTGQCAVSSLKLQELFGWPIAQTKAPNGETHYYNLVHGAPLDVTADQFDGPVTYDNEPVERNRLLDHPGTAARYETLSAVVERELDRRLDAADVTAHFDIVGPGVGAHFDAADGWSLYVRGWDVRPPAGEP